jgi:hypothetical protein
MASYGSFNFASLSEGAEPFVGVSDEPIIVGGKFRTLKRVTIQGKIVPSNFCSNSEDVSSKIKNLLNGIKDDFDSISAGDISAEFARCESIDITQSNFFGTADYTAVFISYPDELSDIDIRVLNPVDSREIVENQDGTISVTRKISAQGIGPDAISNARNFIESLDDLYTAPPVLLKIGELTDPGDSLTPRRLIETIDRTNGIVSVDIEFVYRSTVPNNNVILTQSIDIDYDEKSGLYSVTVSGNLSTGDLTSDSDAIMDSLRVELESIGPQKIALAQLTKCTDGDFLQKNPQNFSTNEDALNSSLGFSYTFTSEPREIIEDISYQGTYDVIRDITTITINGNLTSILPQFQKKEILKKAYENLDLYGLANSFFSKFDDNSKIKLNKNAINSQVTYNKVNETIVSVSFSTEFSNQFEENDPFLKFEYTLTAQPSINVFYPIQFLDGSNGIFDLNFYKRGTISINGSAIGKDSDLNESARSLAISKLDEFANDLGAITRIRVEDNVSNPQQSDNGYLYSFSITENCETEVFE